MSQVHVTAHTPILLNVKTFERIERSWPNAVPKITQVLIRFGDYRQQQWKRGVPAPRRPLNVPVGRFLCFEAKSKQPDVRAGSKAALPAAKSDFRFAPDSGLKTDIA